MVATEERCQAGDPRGQRSWEAGEEACEGRETDLSGRSRVWFTRLGTAWGCLCIHASRCSLPFCPGPAGPPALCSLLGLCQQPLCLSAALSRHRRPGPAHPRGPLSPARERPAPSVEEEPGCPAQRLREAGRWAAASRGGCMGRSAWLPFCASVFSPVKQELLQRQISRCQGGEAVGRAGPRGSRGSRSATPWSLGLKRGRLCCPGLVGALQRAGCECAFSRGESPRLAAGTTHLSFIPSLRPAVLLTEGPGPGRVHGPGPSAQTTAHQKRGPGWVSSPPRA